MVWINCREYFCSQPISFVSENKHLPALLAGPLEGARREQLLNQSLKRRCFADLLQKNVSWVGRVGQGQPVAGLRGWKQSLPAARPSRDWLTPQRQAPPWPRGLGPASRSFWGWVWGQASCEGPRAPGMPGTVPGSCSTPPSWRGFHVSLELKRPHSFSSPFPWLLPDQFPPWGRRLTVTSRAAGWLYLTNEGPLSRDTEPDKTSPGYCMCKGPHLLPEMCFPLALEPEVLKQGVSRAVLPWRLEGGSFTSSSLLRRLGLLGLWPQHTGAGRAQCWGLARILWPHLPLGSESFCSFKG